ncbi:hypothetical protein GHK92_17045 [Nocardioides sp. dk4132]|uniref:hypothetical protein n=1 Tax=unclassified Nocardioides TaxID=2615069 RepID=UPI001294F2C3|nr:MULTISPECIES: hypothetical protein [unclassified Nocardioides]MQW77580.1 hypothetical protein [Nocardioides sp. dk4132]QGA06110.1 hypothetical protein GFH29_00905 [Nocardioides sp. dk884]
MAIKPVTKTSEYGIGQMVHAIHMTDDVPKLQKWWEEVFGGFTYFGVDEPNYLPIEDRRACLLMVRDLCIEVMAPAMNEAGEVNSPQLPVGRFYSKFGQHLHSVGYYVEDIVGLGNHMIDNGIYIGKPGGGAVESMDDPNLMYFYPSPKYTAGLMVEVSKHPMPNDPREKEEWSSLWNVTSHHPLTIERFSYVTLGVRELEPAVEVYVNAFKAVPLEEGIDEDLGAKYVNLHLGDCLLQIAQPLEPTSDLGKHVEQYGNFIYGLRFKVSDVDSAERWLKTKGVRTTRPRPGLLVLDPSDTFNAPIFLSDEEIAGDPFAG